MNGEYENIKYLGYVSNLDKLILLQSAIAFVFLSDDEGFGLPPLEAMKMMTPVITSNKGSLPEVCGNAALYVDPVNLSEIREAILSLYDNKSQRLALIEKGKDNIERFSFETYSQKIKDIIFN